MATAQQVRLRKRDRHVKDKVRRRKRTSPAQARKVPISLRAYKLLTRLRDGHWYRAYHKDTPAAMQELVDAGLVGICGRPQIIVACYVPASGYTPFVPEKFAPSKLKRKRGNPYAHGTRPRSLPYVPGQAVSDDTLRRIDEAVG